MATDVYLFGTCLVNSLYPKSGIASVKLLERAGLRVHFPQNQSCCGQPAWNSGFAKEARAVVAPQLGLFPDDYPIVVPSASCAGMIKHQWPALFMGTSHEKHASALAARVYELTEFIHTKEILPAAVDTSPVRVAIHNSCAAWREMEVAPYTNAALENLAGVHIVEQARPRECCGFGGTFALKQADISGAMVHDKLAALVETEADVVLSQDNGCLMNIATAAAKQQLPLRFMHIASFLYERCYGKD